MDWYVPAKQLTHARLEDAPAPPAYVPCGQRVHVPDPVALGLVAYLPALHGVQLALEDWPVVSW